MRQKRYEQWGQRRQYKIENINRITFNSGVQDNVTFFASCLVNGGKNIINYKKVHIIFNMSYC